MLDFERSFEYVWKKNSGQLRFLESFYSDKLKMRILIRPTYHPTSYYSPGAGIISISYNNLKQFLDEKPSLFFGLFYTLVSHEIAHAVYTPPRMEYTPTLNILEDNRIEGIVARSNAFVRFDLLRYATQDKKITIELAKKSPINITLALLRTVYNRKYVEYFKKYSVDIVNKILALHDKYMLESDSDKLERIALKVESLSEELFDLVNESKEREEKSEPEEKIEEREEKDESEERKDEFEEKDDQDSDSEKEDESERKEGDSEEYNPDDEEKESVDASEKDFESSLEVELEAELQKELCKGEKDIRELNENSFSVLHNNTPDTTPYDKVLIGAYTTRRRSGIKGNGIAKRKSGNAKELSLRRYARREFTDEKLFDKNVRGYGKGTASVVFYLDISGSMVSGYEPTLKYAVDYLKSFYDTMKDYLNIRMFAFGSKTYIIGRNELNYSFIRSKSMREGATILSPLPIKKQEEVIVITDGSIPYISEEYANKAFFVIITTNESWFAEYYKNVKNKVFVSPRNLKEGLDKATEKIKKLLK